MKKFLSLTYLLTMISCLLYATDRHVYSGQSIQTAINASVSGDRVLIHTGTYNQNLSISGKSSLTVTSAGDGTVTVQGDGSTVDVINIQNSNGIVISNLTIKNTRKAAWSTGIYVHGTGSDIQILDNNLTDISYHAGAWNAGDNPSSIVGVNPLMISGDNASSALSNITVSGNTVSYCMTGWNESITVKANVDGFVVENNTVHHVTNIAIDAYGLGSWPNTAQARNGVIRNNIVYNAICNYTDNGGIYVDGGKDILIANNKIYNSKYGITIGCENQGQVSGGTTSGIKVVNNLVYNNSRSGIMIGTSGDDDGIQGEVVNTLVTGNTFLKNSVGNQWGSELYLQNCSGTEFYNNIVYGFYQQMVTEGLGKGSTTFGYNIFYNPVGSPLIAQEVNNWNTISFSAWKGQNNDNSSTYTDPLLVNASATSPNVHLQSTSPGINGGNPNFTPVSGEVDIDGQARIQNTRVDIGVDESGSGGGDGGALPAPWQTSNIGTVGQTGGASHSSGTFTVSGSGADIWGTADGFRYVYQQVTGNVTITAQVATLGNTDPWAKAGVMIRNSLSSNAQHAFTAITPSNGTAFQRRVTTGGTSTNTGTSGAAPYWVRIQRAGNTFTSYSSSNGTNWTQIGSETISMGSTVYVGLAVTSHNNSLSSTATFNNVNLTSGGGGGTTITVDGSLSDWSGISAIATASGQTSQSLKVYDDGTYIYFGIAGSGLGPNYQIFLNTDNNASSGLQHWSFSASGADYYIENGSVAAYTGDGSSWSWNTVGTATGSKSGTVCEVRVVKSLLGSFSSQITVAYADVNNSWSMVSSLGFSSIEFSLFIINQGNSKLAEGSAIGLDKPNGQITAYPNPVHDYLTINLGNQSGISEINIYDLGGRLVFNKITNEQTLKIYKEEIKTKGLLLLRIDSNDMQRNFKINFK